MTIKASDLIAAAQSTLHNGRTEFAKAYYGKDIAADWCGVWTWYVTDKAGMGSMLFGDRAAARSAVAEGVANWIKMAKAKKIWHDGHTGISPGDIVIFDWDHNGIGNHVCIVESISSTINTIEGNGSLPAVSRYNRPIAMVLGYIHPKYDAAEEPVKPAIPASPVNEKTVTYLVPGVNNKNAVKALQMLLNEGGAKLDADGAYGNLTTLAVRNVVGGDGKHAELVLK